MLNVFFQSFQKDHLYRLASAHLLYDIVCATSVYVTIFFLKQQQVKIYVYVCKVCCCRWSRFIFYFLPSKDFFLFLTKKITQKKKPKFLWSPKQTKKTSEITGSGAPPPSPPRLSSEVTKRLFCLLSQRGISTGG